MNLIKLDATDSTNLFLKELSTVQQLPDFTVVSSHQQSKGRGQMGSSWQSEPGKNLTFSILKFFEGLQPSEQFKITLAVSLAIFDVLYQVNIPEIKVKWPNDIMSGNKKICGILIENIIKGATIEKTIVGIGLNVNQTYFEGLDQASSMKIQTGTTFDMEKLFTMLVDRLKIGLTNIEGYDLHDTYEERLFRRNVPTTFIDATQNSFIGSIQGVESTGRLKVKMDNGKLKKFNFKEIKMVY